MATEAEETERREALVELTAGEELPILLVDDLPENLRTLEAVLAPLGIPLRTATSGYEALRMLLEDDFAMILLDVRMPGLDGLETAQLIKGRSRNRDIPIVFLTAAQDELGDIVRGYDVGAVDYVLKPFDAELLRSKVSVFAELEHSRRALKRSEAFLRAAFEAAPVGKTVLDGSRRIVLANPAFGWLLGREPHTLTGVEVSELCHPEDRQALSGALDRVAGDDLAAGAAGQADVDLRLQAPSGSERWVGVVASTIERTELGGPLLLIQWVDLSARRRAEQARAELLFEQSARTHAEAIAERLNKLQALAEATESLSLSELLPELAVRLGELFDAELVEIETEGETPDRPLVVRAAGSRVLGAGENPADPGDHWEEVGLSIERSRVGAVRLALAPARSFSAADRSLLQGAADRAALSIRRAALHEQEHRIAVELQRGLVPKQLPEVAGIELAARYQPASAVAEVGGDWYDAFALPGGRLGVVLGDVAGKGIPAASTMGQLRSLTRAFALTDDDQDLPGDVLTRISRYQLQHGEGELFTVIYAVVDPRQQTVTWASAGHPPPLLRTARGEISYAAVGDGLIGIDDSEYRNLEATLGAGGTLILYTDGLVERRGESLDVGMGRLADATAAGPQQPQALSEHILARLVDDQQLHDDITAVIVKLS